MKTALSLLVALLLVVSISFFLQKPQGQEVQKIASQGQNPASVPTIVVTPDHVIQGEPIMVQVDGVSDISIILKLTFDAKPLGVFSYESTPTAFIGIDLKKVPGTYPLVLTMKDGREFKTSIQIFARKQIEAPLGIPEKLGGNTPAAETALVSNLAKENEELAAIRTAETALWTDAFAFPLPTVFVTDPYGYSRETGSVTVAHKGTDFRAAEDTEVRAMNRGTVRIAKTFTVYGNTVVIDHGLGLVTMYMHLSKINVAAGDLVSAGQVIGLSGQTGYAEHPHLHVTIRIDGISIDAMKFMDFFKK